MCFEEIFVGYLRVRHFHRRRVHAQASTRRGVARRWELRTWSLFFQCNTDVSSLRVFDRISVVSNITVFECIKGVIFSEADILAGEPFCACKGKLRLSASMKRICRRTVLPLCLKIMFPGTTHSEEPFLAPNRLPAESVGPFARPCCACEACRTKMDETCGCRYACLEQRLREVRDDASAFNDASDATVGRYNLG